MARQFPSPTTAFAKALRSFETGGFAYADFLAELRELLASGAPRDELLEILRRREVVEPLPDYARADVLNLLNGSPPPPPAAAQPAAARPTTARPAPPPAPKAPSPLPRVSKTLAARTPAQSPLPLVPPLAAGPVAAVPPVAPRSAPRAAPAPAPAPMRDLSEALRPPGAPKRAVPEESLSSQATINSALAASQVTVPMPAPRPSHAEPDAYSSIFMTPPAELAPAPGPMLDDGSLGAARERFVEALAEARASGPPAAKPARWMSMRLMAWIFAIAVLAFAAWLMLHYAPAPATGPAALPP